MCRSFISACLFILAGSALASAAHKPAKKSHHARRALSDLVSGKSACNVSDAQLSLPTAGDVELTLGDTVKYIALGVGTQSYACGSDSSWQTSGVSATLYDISCDYINITSSLLSSAFDDLTAAAAINAHQSDSVLGEALDSLDSLDLARLGTLTATGKTYTFDLRASAQGLLSTSSAAKGFVSAAISATQAAPVASYNLNWTRMDHTAGALADVVFQVQTAGGMPLTSTCSSGDSTNATFTAQYWFYQAPVSKSQLQQAKDCSVDTTKAKKVMAILTTAVQYGQTGEVCSSLQDCTNKCFKTSGCVGFSISTQDNEGYVKLRVGQNNLGYSPVFTSGIVRTITNKQYVTRQGIVDDCPDGQITGPNYLGCVIPTC